MKVRDRARIPKFLISEEQFLLHALKYLADLPIEFIQSDKNEFSDARLSYKFTLLSWNTVYSVSFGLIFRSFVWMISYDFHKGIVNTNETALDSTSLGTGTKLEEALQNLYAAIVTFVNISEWFSVIATVPLMVEFLNNWKSLNEKKLDYNIKYFIFIIVVPIITFNVISFYWKYKGVMFSLRLLGMIFQYLMFQLVSLLEDVRILYMFRKTSMGYFLVTTIVTDQYHQEKPLNSKISLCKRIREILEQNRKQVELVGRILAFHEILYLVYMLFLLTIVCFLTLSPLSKGGSIFKFSVLDNCFELFSAIYRLYLKAHYAEQITQEERKAARAISSWIYSEKEPSVKFELKHIVDTINANPTRVIYANLVSPQKPLILAVLSQIATYIVILLQFESSSS